MTYYVFAIGGTGARCLESLVYLCAMGLGPRRLHPILVDPDSGNGNLNRTKELIIRYKAIRDRINNPTTGSLFFTEMLFNEDTRGPNVPTEIPNYFNPNYKLQPGTNTLSHFIDYNNRLAGTDGKYLADLLFSSNELEMDMAEGYRGVPSIGSMLMSNIEQHPMWNVLISDLNNNKPSKVFIFASVFGGTGASGYPVISKLIKNKASDAKVGGALLLPYFRLPDPQNLKQHKENLEKEKVLPDSNSFMVNAKAACEFYGDFKSVNSNYVLGDDLEKCAEYKNYQIGSEAQRNDAHMVELFAAYAALDFWERDVDNHTEYYHIQVQNPQEGGDQTQKIVSSDLPDKQKDKPFERFALFCLYVDELYDLAKKDKCATLNMIAWLRNSGIHGKNVLDAKNELRTLTEIKDSYKLWIKQNHTNSAPLEILDPDLNLDFLLRRDTKRSKGMPISMLDVKLCRSGARSTNITDTLVKAASDTELTMKGGK